MRSRELGSVILMGPFQLETFWDSGIHVYLQAQTQSHNNLGETETKDGASPSCGVHQNLSLRSLFSGIIHP